MPKQEGQKTKLLALLHIFEQKTDENHLLNVPQLVELLEQQGILAERKSIYSDIDTLCALGYDIQLRRGRGGGYWMASRAFELSELKLLVDAVQASKVISARTSKKLIRKLEAAMRDRFGQDTLFLPEADGYFHFDVPVCVSDQFYGWVCGFGGKVEVTSPAEVRQGLHDMVRKLAEQHN